NDVPANLERLQGIQSVLVDEIGEGYRLVLDGNEQFADMAGFTDLLDGMRGDSELRHLFDRVLWFEQPVEREAALAEAVDPDLAKPIILDESDGTDETVSRALQLGYAGVSAKNCKGVFRTLHSRRVLAEWEAEHGGPAILAAEDLTHPGVHALQQDTAVIAALGIEHAERNGHHYVRGLSFLPEAEQAAALRDFPSLYERTADGLVRLRIDGGYISTQEICERGYGGEPLLDLDALESLDPSCPPC
ncbi:MAG: mandelate racemase, partial [Planctomycetota bacterium]|nr:mandelate racemase [Planctomycetota bacterium]